MLDFQTGTRVRLVNDPGQIGVLTGRVRERAGRTIYHVQFPAGGSWKPEHDLELVSDGYDDAYKMLERGQFGRLQDLRRQLTYIQLSGRLANLVYSMDTTNTEFYAYQYKPVLSFLESPSKGILIADEVGLGKTIEAGLIWTELRARVDARRLMIVCPAMLREKWKSELQFRFGIEADILGASELLEELKLNRHQIRDGKAIVCSYSGLRPPKHWSPGDTDQSARGTLATLFDMNSGAEPLFDMVIFDEAHYLRNPESSTAKLGKLIRDVSEHLVLLSATPVNLHSQDLFQLLNLVDPDTFFSEHLFPRVLDANLPLLEAQRLILDRGTDWELTREKLLIAQQNPMLRSSQQLATLIDKDVVQDDLIDDGNRVEIANRIERINLLNKVITRTRKADVKELRVIREPFAPLVEMTETESELYQRVTEIVRRYAITQDIHEGFLLATPQRQLSSCMYAAVRAWRNHVGVDDVSLFEDIGTTIKVSPSSGQGSVLKETIACEILPDFSLSELRLHDSKFSAVLNELSAFFDDNPEEKVVLFSYFRETLNYLSERFSEEGFRNQVLMGGMRETKQELIEKFRDDPNCRILLSSEVASEGVDLQFCRVLVNYDLPWNPMRVEQRIGRIDRHGQKSEKIHVLNFCYNDTIDQRIYQRLYDRLEIFQQSLGDMEAILGEKIHDLSQQLLREHLTPEQEEARINQTAIALQQIRHRERELESQAASLIAHSGHILQEVQAAHDFKKRITEQDIVVFVKDFLDRHCSGHEFRQVDPDELIFDILLPTSTAVALSRFIKDQRLFGQTGLDRGQRVRCLFVNKVVKQERGQEQISQFHPLIRFISQELESYDESFVPLISMTLDHQFKPELVLGTYVAVISRTEYEGLRVEENLRARVIHLESGELLEPNPSFELINLIRLNGRDWPEAEHYLDVEQIAEFFGVCEECLSEDYYQEASHKAAENDDRITFQIEAAERHKQRQLESRYSALAKVRAKGLSNLIKANEGQIKKIENSFKVRLEELQQLREFHHNMTEITHLVFQVCDDE